jgi:hypothetical protein
MDARLNLPVQFSADSIGAAKIGRSVLNPIWTFCDEFNEVQRRSPGNAAMKRQLRAKLPHPNRRHRRARGAILAALLVLGSAAPAFAADNTQVFIGGHEDGDACNSLAMVVGLDPQGDGFLAVRTGPGTDSRMIDKLVNGETVQICDGRSGWAGIVYSRSKTLDCGVSFNSPARRPYSGQCLAGCVSKRYLKIIGG